MDYVVMAGLVALAVAIFAALWPRKTGGPRLGARRKRSATGFGGIRTKATLQYPSAIAVGGKALATLTVHRKDDNIEADAALASKSRDLGKLKRGGLISVQCITKDFTVEHMSAEQMWDGTPIEFAIGLAPTAPPGTGILDFRVFYDGALIGSIACQIAITSGAERVAQEVAELVKPKRVFASYSSQDRSEVAKIISAYRNVNIECFFDRTSIRSGEKWEPRLMQEIDRCDVFHLFWSDNARQSDWVLREAHHALNQFNETGKRPVIAIQMLEGPPWPPHPQSLNSLNFDDFLRAAMKGYEE